MQWDKHIPGILWAYRNTPHQSTGEKPSYLLFGFDCRSPTEASLLPTSPNGEVDITDYRRELTLSLKHAQELAAVSIQKAQTKYKEQYDKSAASTPFTVGDMVLVHFPQEESGPKRELSRPWHGPYKVISKNDLEVEVVKVYFSQEDKILKSSPV